MEPMTVRLEIWPVAADQIGIWLVSGGDAWRPALPVQADSEPHYDVETELFRHGALDSTRLLHSTSWRVDGPSVVLTYVAVIHVDGPTRNQWPDAMPVGLGVADAVGKPPTNAPTDPPAPRYIDVLLHAIRHLKFLLGTDATSASALVEPWPTHLAGLDPALAGLYTDPHGRAADTLPT
jgi:hypothetical protein